VLERARVLDAGPGVDRLQVRWEHFDGGMSQVVESHIVGPGRQAVGVLAFDPAADAVVLVEQFRVGAFVAHESSPGAGWVTEIVMGALPPGEDPRCVARTELREELGCETMGDLIEICHYMPDPATSAARVWLFCGRVTAARAGIVRGNAHEHENLRTRIVPSTDIAHLLSAPACANAATLLALQWFQQKHGELHRTWGGPGTRDQPSDSSPGSGG
jgi:ADP-ribose pyrophosphatase